MTNNTDYKMPAISMAAVPGRRSRSAEIVAEIEQRGFSGIYCPSLGDAMALCLTIAHSTSTIEFGTSVQPIYLQHSSALAATAAYIHEISEGRFHLGVGVTHGPVHSRLGVDVGKPLSDIRQYVTSMQKSAKAVGELPPITLATLRDKMVGLSVEIADGAVWANAARSRMGHSLSLIPQDRKDNGFQIGNMIPTVIDDDREAGANRNRATLKGYVRLPNYRNYWKDAGYEEEMTAIEASIDKGDDDGVMAAMSDRWLSDCTLYGSVAEVRDGVEAWFEAGVSTPILVPSSTSGGQIKALNELFDAFS